MAQQMICDFDGANPAVLLVTNLATGDTQKVCAEHVPMWCHALLAVFGTEEEPGLPAPGTGAGRLPEAEEPTDMDAAPGAGPDDDEDDDADESPAVIDVALPAGDSPDVGHVGGLEVPNGPAAGVPAAGGGGGS